MQSLNLSHSHAPVSIPRARQASLSPAAATVGGVPRYLQGQITRVSQPSDPGEQHADQVRRSGDVG